MGARPAPRRAREPAAGCSSTFARPRKAPATARATSSGPVASGGVAQVCCHPGPDESRPDDEHAGAAAGQRVTEAEGGEVQTSLGGAVDPVGAPGLPPRHRGQDDDRPVPLVPQPAPDVKKQAERTDEPGLDAATATAGSASAAAWSPSVADREHRRCRRHPRRTRRSARARALPGLDRVELHHLDPRRRESRPRGPSPRAAAAASSRPASTTRVSRSDGRARTMASPISLVPPSSSTDCGRPSASITGHILRDRSEANRRWGSSRSRTARQLGSRGYMAGIRSGRHPRVLDQIDRAAGRPPRRRPAGRGCGRAGRRRDAGPACRRPASSPAAGRTAARPRRPRTA